MSDRKRPSLFNKLCFRRLSKSREQNAIEREEIENISSFSWESAKSSSDMALSGEGIEEFIERKPAQRKKSWFGSKLKLRTRKEETESSESFSESHNAINPTTNELQEATYPTGTIKVTTEKSAVIPKTKSIFREPVTKKQHGDRRRSSLFELAKKGLVSGRVKKYDVTKDAPLQANNDDRTVSGTVLDLARDFQRRLVHQERQKRTMNKVEEVHDVEHLNQMVSVKF